MVSPYHALMVTILPSCFVCLYFSRQTVGQFTKLMACTKLHVLHALFDADLLLVMYIFCDVYPRVYRPNM